MSTPTFRTTPIDPILNAFIADHGYNVGEIEDIDEDEDVALSVSDDEDVGSIQHPRTPLLLPEDGVVLDPDLEITETRSRASTGESIQTVGITTWLGNLGWKRVMILCTFCFARICSASLGSLLAPFFPKVAEGKGASATEIGLIFGLFQLVIFIASPVFGNFLSQIGAKFMFVAGNIVLSSCGVLYGVLYWCPDSSFIPMCFVVRFVEAVAGAAQGTANLAVASHTFPTRISFVQGMLQAASCIGLTIGPFIGGVLYYAKGYYFPFAVVGCISVLNGFAAIFLLPSSGSIPPKQVKDADSQEQHPQKNPWKVLLSKPIVYLTGLMALMCQATIGFFDVALSLHINQEINVTNPVIIGVVFLVPSGVVIVLAPIYGLLADKFKFLVRPFMICGSFVGGVAMLFMGPCPLLHFIEPYQDDLWLVLVTLAVAGFGWGSLVVAYQEFVTAAQKGGLPENIATHGVVSGLFNAFNSFGAFVGPTAGGFILEKVKYPWACTIFAGGILVSGALLLLYTGCEVAYNGLKNSSNREVGHPSEREPLLDDTDAT